MRKNTRVPSRPAPPVQDALNNNFKDQRISRPSVKKKPPPRPPPPDFNKAKSKSAWNLNQGYDDSLINLSPPESPKNSFVASRNRAFGGSISSSFSSSTSSLASSKKSFEYDSTNWDLGALGGQHGVASHTEPHSTFYVSNHPPNMSLLSVPTIIRAQSKKPALVKFEKEHSPPMPSIPPPSPPKEVSEINVPYGVALFDYNSTEAGDLCLQENDVVFLLRHVNNEWYYGRVENREGMFPSNFVSVEVPLPQDDRIVTALYEFRPQAVGDLALRPGQIVHVMSKISNEWLMGESEGRVGQFPANFVNRIPSSL